MTISTQAEDFSFSSLTPGIILDALEAVGVWPESGLLPLNSYENRVYQFVADDKRRYVVKFYRPARWSNEQILEEHSFVDELAAADIAVVPALKLADKVLHDAAGYRFVVYPSIGGRALEADQLDQLHELGQQIGRMHMVGSAKPFEHRELLISSAALDDAVATLKSSELIPEAIRQPFEVILDLVAKRLASIDFQPDNWLRLHGDCHVGNLLWRDHLTLVDLDDCRQGPAVQDLWMMLSGDRLQQQIQLETLLEGYEEFHPFNKSELKLIEPLRSWRIIQYMAWLAKRWSDPAFPRSFSWFAEPNYWEQQILALKEQLAAFDEPALQLQQGYR